MKSMIRKNRNGPYLMIIERYFLSVFHKYKCCEYSIVLSNHSLIELPHQALSRLHKNMLWMLI